MRSGSGTSRPRLSYARGVRLGLVATALLATGMFLPAGAAGPSLGVIVDNNTHKAVAFNPATNTVVGAVSIGAAGGHDCAIQGGNAFVVNFTGVVRVVDLVTSPPSLASGVNSIPISNPGEDLDFVRGTSTFFVSDGAAPAPLSVDDASKRAETSAFSNGGAFAAVSALADGSALVMDPIANTVRRLVPDRSTSRLADSGHVLTGVVDGNNLAVPPTGSTALFVGFNPGLIESFAVPAMTPIQSVATSGTAMSAAFTPDGSRVLVRTSTSVQAFTYNTATGAIGAAALYTIPLAATNAAFGVEQLAISANGQTFYVTRAAGVDVRNVSNGSLVTAITDPNIVDPYGVCLP